jgi:hypothetical protein
MEILCLDEYLITDFEVQCWSSLGICRSLVTLLGMGHLLMEELMKGIKIHRVFMCASGCEISFRMYIWKCWGGSPYWQRTVIHQL